MTAYEWKEQSVAPAPLLLFDVRLHNGQTERWSTHRAQVAGQTYEPRIARHNLFEMRVASDMGVDAIPRVTVTIANADSYASQIERQTGFKGAQVTMGFLFYDFAAAEPACEPAVVFQGVANAPDGIDECELRVTFTNRLSLQRVLLPAVRIQKRCPWDFPATLEQRIEAITGGAEAGYSRFFRCGYSPDVEGGSGSLDGAAPFTSCGYTRADCEARGMFRADSLTRITRRFGGLEYVPPAITVRTHGDRDWQTSALQSNEARYNDFIPLVYGTVWYTPPVVFARNDGNLTHMDVLLGMGEMQGVLKVVVNDIELPLARDGANMSGTGWYAMVSHGNRTGAFNEAFKSPGGLAAGDPYGSMAYLWVAVPNRVGDGKSLPRVRVLAEGLRLPWFGEDGVQGGTAFTDNPAWILLDLLRRCGWKIDELDLASFARAASYCAAPIAAKDLYGAPIQLPRFACNFAVSKRRAAAELVRGVRNAARILLTYGAEGKLAARVENTLALQHPSKPAWSNAAAPLNGGWPSYEFGDGTAGSSGLLRRPGGQPAIRFWSRPTADTPNRLAVEFQDSLNGYQQDSFSLVDAEDVRRSGQEITAPVACLGIANHDQAARVLKYHLDRSLEGNTYVAFETSVKALGVTPGDIITLTYQREGLVRQPFRVLSVTPGGNYGTVGITAQWHRDEWYVDTNGQTPGQASRGLTAAQSGTPRPVAGSTVGVSGELVAEVTEEAAGESETTLSVRFAAPQAGAPTAPPAPLLSLSPQIYGTGGSLEAGRTYYYAAAARNADGAEGPISFSVRATVPAGSNTARVFLRNLSFPPEAASFNVYRGPSPAQLACIAVSRPLAGEFEDTGLPLQPIVPRDDSFDHVNLHWRCELTAPCATTAHGPASITGASLALQPDEVRGQTLVLLSGRGAGQERRILSNTATTLTVSPKWNIEPDLTTTFVVTDTAWRFAGAGAASPIAFSIPQRPGAYVQISIRAANSLDNECAAEISPLVRWRLGAGGGVDLEPPPAPSCALEAKPAGGLLLLSAIAFQTMAKTSGIRSATITLHYTDEFAAPGPALAAAVDAGATEITFAAPGSAAPGRYVQIGREVMCVLEVVNGGLGCIVERGVHESPAESHAAGAATSLLLDRTETISFPPGFFGTPASGTWRHEIALPGARVATVELYVTNAIGDSPVSAGCFTTHLDRGLRTHTGGQIALQVAGYAAEQTGAAPPLTVSEDRTVRDVFATVRQAPSGAPLISQVRRNGDLYCELTIAAGATESNAVRGSDLPPLRAGDTLDLDVVSVGSTLPGSDLTVTIRL